jgi:hypothetical protein
MLPVSFRPNGLRKSPAIATFTDWSVLEDGEEVGPRSYRDTKATAVEGAEYLKQRHPHSEVTVRDTKSGEVTVVVYKSPK